MTLKDLLKLTRKEVLFLGILMILYGSLAFFNLGSRDAPETYACLTSDREGFEFKVSEAPSVISLYAPVNDQSKYVGLSILSSSDTGQWTRVFDTREDQSDYTAAMVWYTYPLHTAPDDTLIRIEKLPSADRLVLSEVQFLNREGASIPAKALNHRSHRLLDEPETVCTVRDRMNSAYFDESYFPSSALEMADGLTIAEMDHPPVGRLFIGLGMKIFGRNPFGFRCMQAFLGILMLPLIYLTARTLFNSSRMAKWVALLLALDFMHYTQTRIGTLDAFLVFFILIMYAFMLFYTRCQTSGSRRLSLFISGFSTGLAIATKWSGCYAALGLMIFYFVDFYKDWQKKESALRRQRLREILWCLLCFIVLPATIYLLSYLPYVRCMAGDKGFLKTVIDHQIEMLGYHTGSETHFVHPYSSKWWTWFLALKPVFYYFQTVPETIWLYGTGNPLVWGIGLMGCLYALFKSFSDRDQSALLIAAGYFSQLIPWLFITRDTFLYHYFPMVPFLILGLGYLIQHGPKTTWGNRWCSIWAFTLLVLAAICFVLAYPFIGGTPMRWETLKWLRTAFLVLTGVMGLFLMIILISDRFQHHNRKDL